jgi:DDE superfamily endonuclease
MSWSSTTSPATRSRACARRSRRAAGAALLYLPPCSPDLNPVELAFSKLKRLLQAAAARTVGALWNAIGRLLGHFSPAECAAYFSTAAIHSQADNGLAVMDRFACYFLAGKCRRTAAPSLPTGSV